MVALALTVEHEAPPPSDLKTSLDHLTTGWAFNFASWELEALARKAAYGFLSAQRFMTDDERSRFVLDYLDDVAEARRLSDEINRIYVDPEVEEPEGASREQQAALAELRRRMALASPIAEAIVEEQVSQVLAEANLGLLASILPPVSGTFTPLPHILIVSPRAQIETIYQQQLIAGLTAASQEQIEQLVEGKLPDHSAYVTGIGGLAAYPAMLLEVASIDWVADVVAHEWVHHYLIFRPLGWNYMRNGEARTINETTASLVGDWAGQEVVLRFYAHLLELDKGLPDVLARETSPETPHTTPTFDYGAEMHYTRVTVDSLLAEGRIEEAEQFMEDRRRYFVANGYRIRRLNQAYFAFHGAYASTPGAAGADPIGALVRRVWAVSKTPGDFLRKMGPLALLDDLQAAAPN